MSKRRFGILALSLLLALTAAPFAFATEEYPPVGFSRITVYWGGTCNVSKTYRGHAELNPWCPNEYFYEQGSLSGKWRHKQDNHCSGTYSYNKYEVCVSGSNCTEDGGGWQEITQTQFHNEYCP